MATSLSITAGGIILAYLLVHVTPDFTDSTKPMNAILLDRVAGHWRIGGWNAGYWFVLVALCSEAGLLLARSPSADRLRRRAAWHGQHGRRLVAASPVLPRT